MGSVLFSLLTNFYKSFDKGKIIVVISSTIPIFLLGMTGIVDEAFAQNQSATSDLTPVYVGEVDVKNLKKPTSNEI